MKFTQPTVIPHTPVLPLDVVTPELRTALWNCFIPPLAVRGGGKRITRSSADRLATRLWAGFLGYRRDQIPSVASEVTEAAKQYLESAPWYRTYDFVEFALQVVAEDERPNGHRLGRERKSLMRLLIDVEAALQFHGSGLRLQDRMLVPITDPVHLAALQVAMDNAVDYRAVIHLAASLRLLSQRPTPNLRGSLLEALAAVEALVVEITAEKDMNAGLARLASTWDIHPRPGLKRWLGRLRPVSQQSNAAKAEVPEVPSLGMEDTVDFLVSCSGFMIQVLGKARRSGGGLHDRVRPER